MYKVHIHHTLILWDTRLYKRFTRDLDIQTIDWCEESFQQDQNIQEKNIKKKKTSWSYRNDVF